MKNFILTLLAILSWTISFAGNHCEYSHTLYCGETYSGTTEWGCSNNLYDYAPYGYGFHGPEKVFKVYKPSHNGRLTLTLFNPHGLDLFLLDECNGYYYNTIASDEITSSSSHMAAFHFDNLPSGNYYAVVDSRGASGDFKITATCSELDCYGADELYCKEWKHDDNYYGDNNISLVKKYGTPYYGYTSNEKLYFFEIFEHKQVSIKLNGFGNHDDFDLFLLNDCNADAVIALSGNNAGYEENITKDLAPGKYYVLVEGYNCTEGNFSLFLDYQCCEDQYNYFCNDISYTVTNPLIYPAGNPVYTFTVPNNSLYLGAVWTIKGGQFGTQGQEFGNPGFSNSIELAPGNYTVTVKYPLQYGYGCFAYCCKDITVEEPCVDECDDYCNIISCVAPSNGLSHNFGVPISIPSGSWSIVNSFGDELHIGSGHNLTWSFPTWGTFTIVYKYLKADGCYFFCKKTITIPEPCENYYDYSCNDITYTVTNPLIYPAGNPVYTFTLPNNSLYLGAVWTIKGGQFGTQGQEFGNPGFSNSIELAPGNYTVTVKYPLQYGYGCFGYCCKDIFVEEPCVDECDDYCNIISCVAPSNGLSHNFGVPSSIPSGSWSIVNSFGEELPIGSGHNLTWSFPTWGTFTIVYKYLKADGCYFFCKKTITIVEPCYDEFDEYCSLISCISPSNDLIHEFGVTGSTPSGSWSIEDEFGNETPIGGGHNLTWTFPSFGTFTIIYKYLKADGCYYFCKKVITIYDPCYEELDEVCDYISFHYSGSGFGYNFSVPNSSDLANGTWTIKGGAFGTNEQTAGTNTSLFFNFPSPGRYTVTYAYTNSYGIFTQCCKTIWIDNPFDCGLITQVYDEYSHNFELGIDNEFNGNIVEWRDLSTNQVLGASSNVVVTCPSYGCTTITATVFDPYAGCFRVCLVEICEVETCFEDPFSYDWIDAMRVTLLSQCGSFPGQTIETAMYNGQCVIIAPMFGTYDAPHFVYDEFGNILFSFGGLNPSYNEHLIAQCSNREIICGCAFGGLVVAEESAEIQTNASESDSSDSDEIVLEDIVTTPLATTTKSEITNAPNPFTTETLISFTLPKTMDVKLKIVDALGKEVFDLSGEFFEGENEFLFSNEKNLPAGMYFLSIAGKELNLTKSLVIQ